MGVHLPHHYGKILVVALGFLGCPLDGLSCSQKKILMGRVILGPFWKIMGKTWAEMPKIHIFETAHGTDLVDPSF